jgi:acyl-CoA reductase-like NAD-dependent aldehyde dehydrogenase
MLDRPHPTPEAPTNDCFALARALSGHHFIGGRYVPALSGKTFAVVNPATGQEIGRAADGDAADVDAAVASAAVAQKAWAKVPARKRGAMVQACAAALKAHVDELGHLIALETGKALRTESRVEANVVADVFEFFGGLGSELKGESVPFAPNVLSVTVREPLGVVGAIIPWNVPMLLMALKVAPALVAGNAVVVKSAEEAPLAVLRICEILNRVLPPGVFNMVSGFGPECGAPLVAHPQVRKVTFTGSVETGKIVAKAAAEKLVPVTLELGGKSPVLVLPDADLDVTARRIAWTKLLNSGQTCIAPDYVLADRAIARELTEKIVATIAKFRADQTNASLRIVNERQFDRLVSLLATTSGTVVTGGGSDRATLSIDPTVIVDPAPDDPVMADEIFGPILPIITVGSTEEAVAFVNSRPKPLALYVFTASQDVGRDLVDRMPSGGAVINHIARHCLVPQLPFGGIGASGMGAYHGQWGFEALSHRRAVLSKPAKPDPSLLYPPYTDRAMKILRRLLKHAPPS